jgi:hypothetical protein
MATNDDDNDKLDSSKYHRSKDISGTVIPRANKDGGSLGFNPNVPGKVVVDPGESDGGFELDFSNLAADAAAFNTEASRAASEAAIVTFYKSLSKKQQTIKKALESNSAEPFGATTNPKSEPLKNFPGFREADLTDIFSDLDAAELVQAFSNLTRLDEESPGTAKNTAKKSVKLPGTTSPTAVVSDKAAQEKLFKLASYALKSFDQLKAASGQTADNLNSIYNLLQEINKAQDELLNQMAASVDEEDEKVKIYSSLQIPFLVSDQPEKPKYDVYFDFMDFGVQATKYHEITFKDPGLWLYYDTRFDTGIQYLPPTILNTEVRIKVFVPKLNKHFSCMSPGLYTSLGCVDIVSLIVDGVSDE